MPCIYIVLHNNQENADTLPSDVLSIWGQDDIRHSDLQSQNTT